MTTAFATVNLGSYAGKTEKRSLFLPFLLKIEAWLDRRASQRVLYRMDDRGLADIGLSRADVEGVNGTSSTLILSDPMDGR
jgi:uncharacterized protein YjiS (DUF1127 family)